MQGVIPDQMFSCDKAQHRKRLQRYCQRKGIALRRQAAVRAASAGGPVDLFVDSRSTCQKFTG
jgi:hypothetical protein